MQQSYGTAESYGAVLFFLIFQGANVISKSRHAHAQPLIAPRHIKMTVIPSATREKNSGVS